jgi:arsenate reductase
MKLYGLKTCDTCRKALKALPHADFVDVRGGGVSGGGVPGEVLVQAHAAFGAKLVNTASTTWRGLSEAERGHDPLDLLRAHPALMKRPLIAADDGTLYLGWGKDVQAALLG